MTSKFEKIVKAYDSPPWWYDIRGFLILKSSYRSGLFRQIRLFSNNIQDPHLEVAVGTGTLLSICLIWRGLQHKRNVTIEAFDLSPAMLAGAHRRLGSKAHLFVGDVSQIPYEDSHFASVNIPNSIHCFPEPAKALSEIHRVLKPKGQLALNALIHPPQDGNFLNRLSLWVNDWGSRKGILNRAFGEQEILSMVENAQFKIVKQTRSGNSLELVLQK